MPNDARLHAWWCHYRWSGMCDCADQKQHPTEHSLGSNTAKAAISANQPPRTTPYPAVCECCGLPFMYDLLTERVGAALRGDVKFFCEVCIELYRAIEHNEYFRVEQRKYQLELADRGKRAIWPI